MGEDPRRAGVPEHPGDAVLGVVRVDGQMGGARLLDGELGDDQVDRARQDHRDELPRTDARGAQRPGRLLCPPVQFGVRQGAVRRVHGHGVRPAVALFGDEPGPGAGRGGGGPARWAVSAACSASVSASRAAIRVSGAVTSARSRCSTRPASSCACTGVTAAGR